MILLFSTGAFITGGKSKGVAAALSTKKNIKKTGKKTDKKAGKKTKKKTKVGKKTKLNFKKNHTKAAADGNADRPAADKNADRPAADKNEDRPAATETPLTDPCPKKVCEADDTVVESAPCKGGTLERDSMEHLRRRHVRTAGDDNGNCRRRVCDDSGGMTAEDRVVDEMNFLLGKMTSVCRKDITCEESNICKLNEPKRNCFPKFENNVQSSTVFQIKNTAATNSKKCNQNPGIIYQICKKSDSNYSLHKTILPICGRNNLFSNVDPVKKAKLTRKMQEVQADSWKFDFDKCPYQINKINSTDDDNDSYNMEYPLNNKSMFKKRK